MNILKNFNRIKEVWIKNQIKFMKDYISLWDSNLWGNKEDQTFKSRDFLANALNDLFSSVLEIELKEIL